jgi:hypothetical protein
MASRITAVNRKCVAPRIIQWHLGPSNSGEIRMTDKPHAERPNQNASFRASLDELARYRAAATATGKPLSRWIREALGAAAKRVLRRAATNPD